MIVIAIIGVLAAALFPSMTGYLKRSRDTARQAGMKDISSSLSAYFSDKEVYPPSSASGCITSTVLSSSYMPKWVPVDPTSSSRNNGCGAGSPAFYGYGTGTIGGSPAFVLTAMLENENAGNTGGTVTDLDTNFAGQTFAFTAAPATQKGSGSGYIMYN